MLIQKKLFSVLLLRLQKVQVFLQEHPYQPPYHSEDIGAFIIDQNKTMIFIK